MKRNSFLLLCIHLLWLGAKGQDTISYELLMERIRNNHPAVLYAKNIGRSGELMLRAAKGGYDPVLSADYEEKFYTNKNYYTSANAVVKQPVFASHYITAGYNYMQGAYANPQLETPPAGIPFLGIEASLLQGLTMDRRRYELQKAKHNRNYYEAEQKILTNEVLYKASSHYFDWLYSLRERQIYEYFTFLAEQRLSGIKALAGAGEMAGVDSVEAAILYRSRSLDLQSVLVKNNQKLNGVFNNNWAETTPASITMLAPADSFEYWFVRARIARSAYLSDTMEANPVLQKLRYQRSVLETEKRYKAELVKPRLDLKYNFLSTSTNYPVWSLNPNNYKWGLNFSWPLFMRTSRNELLMARLNIRNNDYVFLTRQTELAFKTKLIQQNISLLEQQLENAETNLNYSRILLEAEKQKFDHGESSLFLLNTRESRWMEAELKLAEYRYRYIINMLELVYLRGDLSYGWKY